MQPKFSRVLVPLDGSTWSEAILPVAKILAGAFDAHLTLLHVVDRKDLSPEPDLIPEDDLEGMGRTALETSRIYLERLSEGTKDLKTDKVVRLGNAIDVILEESIAAPNDSTLIAMSTHGRRGPGRWFFGSVTDKVIQGGRHSMLIVRPTPEGMAKTDTYIREVVVPLDGSELSEKALPVATALSARLCASLVLVRVVPVPPVSGPDSSIGIYPDLMTALEANSSMYLQYMQEKLQQSNAQRITTYQTIGDPAGEILNLAQNYEASLVVMTSRGRSGIARALLGSVADRVICHARRPVLLVRP